jgi:hypothetical protein
VVAPMSSNASATPIPCPSGAGPPRGIGSSRHGCPSRTGATSRRISSAAHDGSYLDFENKTLDYYIEKPGANADYYKAKGASLPWPQ